MTHITLNVFQWPTSVICCRQYCASMDKKMQNVHFTDTLQQLIMLLSLLLIILINILSSLSVVALQTPPSSGQFDDRSHGSSVKERTTTKTSATSTTSIEYCHIPSKLIIKYIYQHWLLFLY